MRCCRPLHRAARVGRFCEAPARSGDVVGQRPCGATWHICGAIQASTRMRAAQGRRSIMCRCLQLLREFPGCSGGCFFRPSSRFGWGPSEPLFGLCGAQQGWSRRQASSRSWVCLSSCFSFCFRTEVSVLLRGAWRCQLSLLREGCMLCVRVQHYYYGVYVAYIC
jgi:hypothetical protein